MNPFFKFPLFLNSLFFGGFDEKSFLAFLVSGKLDDKLRDNLLKKRFFRGFSGAKRERMVSNTSYLFKRISFTLF
ncbi:hypothetical protein EC524_04675 [Helicobacter pylori]|nr:hypothetical protein EC524_04675 [Helicobacter pylori]RVZ90666.1 hypothetical protein EC597_08120 [Helicobacter pylori]